MAKKKNSNQPEQTDAQKLAEKKAKFVDLFEKQVSKSIDRIGLVANLAAPNYSYTDEQWRAGILAMRVAIDGVESAFKKGGKSKAGFTLPK